MFGALTPHSHYSITKTRGPGFSVNKPDLKNLPYGGWTEVARKKMLFYI